VAPLKERQTLGGPIWARVGAFQLLKLVVAPHGSGNLGRRDYIVNFWRFLSGRGGAKNRERATPTEWEGRKQLV